MSKRILAVILVLALHGILLLLLQLVHGAMDATSQRKVQHAKPVVAALIPKKQEVARKQKLRNLETRTNQKNLQMHGMRSQSLGFQPDLGVTSNVGADLATEGIENSVTVFEEGQVERDAVPIRMDAPVYPEEASVVGASGKVTAIFVVNTEGRTQDIEIRRSPHVSLGKAMRKAIAGWEFEPAMNQGVPVPMRKRITMDFKVQ